MKKFEELYSVKEQTLPTTETLLTTTVVENATDLSQSFEKKQKNLNKLIEEKFAEANKHDVFVNALNQAEELLSATENIAACEKLNSPNGTFKQINFAQNTKQDINIRSQKDTKQTDINLENNNNALKCNNSATKQSVLQTPNYDYIEAGEMCIKEEFCTETEKLQKRKKSKFRMRLCGAVCGILLAVCCGWVVGNAISINSAASSIEKTEYSISEIQYIIKISQLDSYEQITNGQPNAITSIIEITPPALAQPTEIQPQTNWFNNFCNWLSGIFG